MSSANGSQNLFTNIFRPVYRYEIPVGGSTAMFTPAVDVCNIDVISANSISGFTAAIGDENENVYVGSNAGNDYSNLRGCSNVTAVGYAAASLVSNVKNSVYVGYNSGAGAADSSVNVAIGPETKGNGISNIYIGSNTGSLGTGFNNILIGHNLTGTNLSNTLLIGPTPTIYGNLSTRKVGIGVDPSYNMDVSGDSRISYRLGVGMAPGSAVGLSNVPHALDVSGFSYINGALGINADPADYTMNVNGRFNVDDGNGSLRLTSDGCGNSVIEARPRAGKNLVFNIQGDLCATAIIIPGASYTGNVTASNLISSNDISGPMAHVTNIYGNTVYGTDVSGATARFGSLFAESFNPAAISVAVLTAGNGSVSTPSLTFSGDASAGLYLPSASNVAFTTAGVERMRISNAFVGIGTNIPRSALDVSTNIRAGTPGNTTNTARLEIGGGYTGSATAATNSYPTLAFQYGDSAGGYRHFIRTRHDTTLTSANNSIDIFTNNSTTAAGSTAPGTSNLLALSITSAGVGVGLSNPAVALDVSGALRSTAATSNSVGGVTLSNTNLTLAGTITGSTANTSNVIGGVVLSNNNISNSGTTTSSNFIGTASASNTIGGVVLSNTSLISTTVRNAATNWTTDISGGIVDTSSAIVANFLRNARTPSLFDISGGNISNSATHTTSNLLSSNGYIRTTFAGSIGVDMSAGNARVTGSLIVSNGINAPGSNVFGGTTLNGNVVILPGAYFNSNILLATGSAAIRDTDPGFAYDISEGRFRGVVGSVSNPTYAFLAEPSAGVYRPGVGQFAVAVGGVQRLVVSNSNVGIGRVVPRATLDVSGDVSANGFLASAYIRNAIIPTNLDISGGNISNNATTRSSNFITATASSNSIGGIVLSNTNISNAGETRSSYFTSTGATSNNSVGGVSLSNGSVNAQKVISQTGFEASNLNTGYLWTWGGRWYDLDPAVIFPPYTTFTDISGGNIYTTGYSRASNFRASNGTVSTPTHTFLADLSAGFYRPGTNQLGFTTAGLPRMVISNNNVGIGTAVPLGALDVSGQGSTIYVGATASTNGLIIQGYSNSGYIRPQLAAGTLYLGASNSNTVTILEDHVGINKTAPVYTLDISASPGTAASIQMNTWTRTTASVSYYGVYASVATNAVTWTTSNSMDSNLITVGVNNGTYFTVNRSGIYSINAYINGGVGLAVIDVSTVITHTGFSATTMPQLAVASSGATIGQLNVTYTGFLPSNANNYYKIKINTSPSAGYTGGRLYITFLGESPTVTGVPY